MNRLRIKGMHCASCEMLIKEDLEDAGFAVKEISADKGLVVFEGDPGKARDIIRNAGYDAE